MIAFRGTAAVLGAMTLAAALAGCSDNAATAEPGSSDCTARLTFNGAPFTEVGFTSAEVAEPVGTGVPVDCADGAVDAPNGPTSQGVPVYSYLGYDPSEVVVGLQAGSSYRVYAADSLTDEQEIKIREELGTAE